MPSINFAIFVGAIVSFSRVTAHGVVSGIVADGVYYQGYTPSLQYQNPPPKVVGWSIPEDLSTGFVDPNNYTTPEIICHLGATPGQASASVKAGGTVTLEWTPWPVSHHGPVIDYLANCNGECTMVDKTTLKFNKIDGVGLINDKPAPGTWASDQLIANNNSWTVTIPTSIAPGNYVLRHEIIALHSAENADGAQNYPQCINLQITGSGTNSLASGTLGKVLYTSTDPGVLVNIYTTLTSYLVPGPPLMSGANSTTPTSNGTYPNTTLSAAPAPTSSVAAVVSSVIPATSVAPATTSVPAVTYSYPLSSAAPASTTIVASMPTTPASIPQPIVSTLPTIPKSGSGAGAGTVGSGGGSSNAAATLPAGITLKDVLTWLDVVLEGMFKGVKEDETQKARVHARAF